MNFFKNLNNKTILQSVEKNLTHSKQEGGTRIKNASKKTNFNLPLVSVITVVYNGSASLEQTIISIINQSYSNIEYIIIDGASQDNTLNIVDKYEDNIDYWISEPDQGVYDAMNKGVLNANGDWILFLGSDDILANVNTLQNVFDNENIKLDNNSEFDILLGNVIYRNNNLINSSFNNLLKLRNTVHHQAAFYKKKIFLDFKYNPNFKVSADYELNLKLFLEGAVCLKVNQIIAICSPDGISGACSWSGYSEEINIRSKYLSSIESGIYNILTVLRFTLKKFISTLFTNCNRKRIAK